VTARAAMAPNYGLVAAKHLLHRHVMIGPAAWAQMCHTRFFRLAWG
jgi:hypothetical protein